MLFGMRKGEKKSASKFLGDSEVFPQTIDVLRTRADPFGIELEVVDLAKADVSALDIDGRVFQYPNNSAIMGSAPAEYLGVAGGLLHLTRLLGQIVGIAVLGSIWATRVVAASGGTLPDGGATNADPMAQVAGLHLIFLIAGVIMVLAAIIGAWGLSKEREALTFDQSPSR